MMTPKQCEQELAKHLSGKRFNHCRNVAEEAVRLARRYGADPEKAQIAGLLHDIMKETPGAEQLKLLDSFGIMMSTAERSNPKLWHAISGAAFLEHELGISDAGILDAVRCHTSGRKDMTRLDKVLFVADYISADRDYPGVEEMRRAAKKSLEEAMLEGIAFTVGELMEQRAFVAPGSVDAYNDALALLKKPEPCRK